MANLIYEKIWNRLEKLGATKVREYKKIASPPFMDLHIDRLLPLLDYEGNQIPMIAMAHNYVHPSGDLIPDPDMQILLYPDLKMAEALSFQDSIGYQQAYSDDKKYQNDKLKKSLNNFLLQWLKNLEEQGFC